MTKTINEVIDNLQTLAKNPANVQQISLNVLDEITRKVFDGVDVEFAEATNPLPYLIEMSGTHAAATIEACHSISRKKYRKTATSDADLYQYMTDTDFIDRWATPATGVIRWSMLERDILKYAKVVTDSIDYNLRRIVIPKDTWFEINGNKLGIHYPINIDVLDNDGYQIYSDTEIHNPLFTPKNDIIRYRRYQTPDGVIVEMEIPVWQFSLESHEYPIDKAATFIKSITFEDKFHYLRAYRRVNDSWVEMHVTHSAEIYDSFRPTMLLTVTDNILQIYIPDIYTNTERVKDEIRVDVYTTKGKMLLDLGEFVSDDYSGSWKNLNKFDLNEFSVNLDKMTYRTLYSTELLSGGSNGLSFAELRDKLVYHVDRTKDPVTIGQLTKELELDGFDVQKQIDNYLSRVYTASNYLPYRQLTDLSLAAHAFNARVSIDTTDIANGDAIEKFNNGRVVIRANSMFEVVNNRVKPLTVSDVNNLANLNSDPSFVGQLMSELNSKAYYYTPFTYIVDSNFGGTKCRPYSLSTCAVEGRLLGARNTRVGYSILTETYSVEPLMSIDGYQIGFRLEVVVLYPDDLFDDDSGRELLVQLRMTDSEADLNHYMIGELVGTHGKRRATYEFNIVTNMDIDESNRIKLLNTLPMFGYVPLEFDYELFYIVKGNDDDGYQANWASAIDQRWIHVDSNDNPLPNFEVWLAVTQEIFTIKLGDYLNALYAPCRVIPGEPDYVRYTTDVMAFYTEKVFKSDPVTGFEYTIVDEGLPTEEIVLTVEHEIGDPILDENGDQVYLHRAGDIMKSNGVPIIINGGVVHEITEVGLTLIDARYNFVTDAKAVEYRDSLIVSIIDAMDTYVKPMEDRIPERHELYYRPKGSVGDIAVRIGNGKSIQMSPRIVFKVTYHVSNAIYSNSGMRNKIETKTRSILGEFVKRKRLSIAELYALLRESSSKEVYGIDVEKFGDEKNQSVITLVDKGDSLYIASEIYTKPDNSIDIRDLMEIGFVVIDS